MLHFHHILLLFHLATKLQYHIHTDHSGIIYLFCKLTDNTFFSYIHAFLTDLLKSKNLHIPRPTQSFTALSKFCAFYFPNSSEVANIFPGILSKLTFACFFFPFHYVHLSGTNAVLINTFNKLPNHYNHLLS